ncbi:MAG: hypothetical protein IPH20_18080 [Bacteroidales bacterium]|nr:hypothetical protein [Bacteroidales bacterium]
MDEATEILCNLIFIQAKAAAGLAFGLIEDFNTIMAVIPTIRRISAIRINPNPGFQAKEVLYV